MKDKERLEDFKLMQKLTLIGFFAIAILGTILHFTYEISNNNLIVATFSAVNESVWEHLKIAIMPVFLWTFIEFLVLKYRQPNIWTSLLVKIITITLTITISYYLYTFIFKTHILWLDIALFYVAILLGQLFGYREMVSKKNNPKFQEIAEYLVILIFLMFVFFTFIPPHLEIFRDEVTSTYGVFELEY